MLRFRVGLVLCCVSLCVSVVYVYRIVLVCFVLLYCVVLCVVVLCLIELFCNV